LPPDVSICVATCRRPLGLARLLASLEQLERPDALQIEVLVVDNDPDASAAPVLARFSSLPGLRSFCEPERNIAKARNRAVREARGRWLAFVDDDEAVEPDWLLAYWRQLEEAPCDGCFGPVLPRLERVVTPWLDPQGFFAGPRLSSGTLVSPHEMATNNAFVRAELFAQRRFDPAFGLSGGSDTELFARMWRGGALFRWCDEARVNEWIPPARHRLGWLTRRAFRGGVVHTQLERRRLGLRAALRRGLPRACAGLLFLGIGLPLAALAGRASAARVWLRGCTQAGHLWALAGGAFHEYGAV
jgi:succinoglycan biosynthesis protein ExoM